MATSDSTVDVYGTLGEVGRLMVSLERMNVDNASPIFGVAEAADLGFSESVMAAEVNPNISLQSHPTHIGPRLRVRVRQPPNPTPKTPGHEP